MTALSSKGLLPALTAMLACSVLTEPAGVEARDWPQWRGPDQTMVSLGNGVFDGDGFELEVVWKRPLGPAYSSISVVGGRAVTMFSDGTDDHLVALEGATGRELWRYRIASTYEGHSASEPGPRGTPTIEDGVVYGLGPHGHLFAVRLADGGELWSRNLVDELGAKEPEYGFSTPPILVDGVLVVETGAGEGGAVAGFDPKTGERLWTAGNDTVGHQSPLAVDLAGERQVLAVTSHFLMGVEPTSGELLWQFRHTGKPGMEGGWTQPLVLDGDKVLLSYWDASPLHQVRRGPEGYSVSELWRSRALKVNSLMPIFYDGYLYGFNQRFLTCVDPATGKAVWKSRPPGYGGLVLVDGHLVVLAPKGDMVVAEASPEGYREKARLKLFERHSLAPASFADGLVYARDMNEIAAVAVTRKATRSSLAQEPTPSPGGKFGRFLERVRSAGDKAAVIAEFLEANQELPIVEGDDLVHFVYTGGRGSVGLTGNMLDVGDEVSLDHVDGTDFHYQTLRLEPAGIWEYAFAVGYRKFIPDPRNPRRIDTPRGTRSLVATPGWQEEEHLAECGRCETGRLDTWKLKTKARGDEREVRVYLPAGYDDGEERYPLLIVAYGGQALKYGRMRRSLDNLIGKRIAPAVVAFVPAAKKSDYSRARFETYSKIVVEEVLVRLREKYRLLPGPENTALTGAAGAALAAVDTATRYPDVFGKVALQSYVALGMGARHGLGEVMLERIAETEKKDTAWYVEWRRRDLKSEPGLEQAGFWTRDATADSRRLARTLREKGYDVRAEELPGGAGWSAWSARAGEVLEFLFPRSGP